MAAIELSSSAYGVASAANRFGLLFSTLVGSVVSWNDARVTRRALNALSDRELDDIGLVRGDIETVVSTRF